MNAEYYNVSVSIGQKKDSFPKVSARFSRDDDGHGYTASVDLWPNGDDGPDCMHSLWVRQASPLGMLWIVFDGFEGGCWRSVDISGSTLNERDLEWATAWAVEAMRNKHEAGLLCPTAKAKAMAGELSTAS